MGETQVRDEDIKTTWQAGEGDPRMETDPDTTDTTDTDGTDTPTDTDGTDTPTDTDTKDS